jgi:putative flippase GtrA
VTVYGPEVPDTAEARPSPAAPAARVRRLEQWVRAGDGAGASFVRFIAVGGISNVVYVVAFWLLTGSGTQLANAVGFLASTMLANELHRRLTFHARTAVRWYTAQWEGGGLAVAGLAVTSLSLAGLDQLTSEPSTLLQSAVLVAATGLVGLVRFLALRAWFRPGGGRWAPARVLCRGR